MLIQAHVWGPSSPHMARILNPRSLLCMVIIRLVPNITVIALIALVVFTSGHHLRVVDMARLPNYAVLDLDKTAAFKHFAI